jgi:hypothetical protein
VQGSTWPDRTDFAAAAGPAIIMRSPPARAKKAKGSVARTPLLRLTGNPTFLFCRLYHFDLPHNFLQKTRNFLESCLRNHQCGLAVIPAKQDGYHSRSGGEFGPRINLS